MSNALSFCATKKWAIVSLSDERENERELPIDVKKRNNWEMESEDILPFHWKSKKVSEQRARRDPCWLRPVLQSLVVVTWHGKLTKQKIGRRRRRRERYTRKKKRNEILCSRLGKSPEGWVQVSGRYVCVFLFLFLPACLRRYVLPRYIARENEAWSWSVRSAANDNRPA